MTSVESLRGHSSKKSSWETALGAFLGEFSLGSDGIGLFALQLRFDIDDVATVAAEALTGGGDDKKCDLLWIDTDRGVAVIAQCYMSQRARAAARSNKAADLSSAISWLLVRPLDDLPENLKGRASELRDAVTQGKLERFHIWYVHNLPESANCRDELTTVAHSTKAIFRDVAPTNAITVIDEEIGSNKLAALYDEAERTIRVTDEIEVTSPHAFEVASGDWKSLVTTVTGQKLYQLYTKYKVDLFSANLRDYLGSKASDSNINNGIKSTAQQEPADFWVYNNGITALTLEYEVGKRQRGKYRIKLTGISIVNGAQTTGSIGSLSREPANSLIVPIRIVKTVNEKVIENVVRYNNSQNKVQASDFRSTDSIQTRLRQEFAAIPQAEYDGGRRGGARDAMRRKKNLLPSYTVGQALAAFHGDPVTAYDKKSEIWVNDGIYLKYFNDQSTARHIVFTYTLLEALHRRYRLLRHENDDNVDMQEQNKSQLEFLDKRGASYLMIYAISQSMETIVGRPIPNKFRLQFSTNIAPEAGAVLWDPILDVTLPLSRQLDDCFLKNRITNDKLKITVVKFAGLIASLSGAHRPIFEEFRKHVEVKR